MRAAGAAVGRGVAEGFSWSGWITATSDALSAASGEAPLPLTEKAAMMVPQAAISMSTVRMVGPPHEE
jgi:hypothetical protein